MTVDINLIFDENERQRMLAEGYQPEVIEYQARERLKDLQNEFLWKNAILRNHFEALPYFAFVEELFPGLDKLMVITSEESYQEMDVDELVDYQATRSDVYVAPASFINGCYKAATCKDLYALVVDIDRIHPETLQAVIENGNLGGMTPMPTYIVNSGRGVHFYYVFKEPVPFYRVNHKAIKTMYRTLCGITKQNILAKTDWHAVTQPFRLPGSLSRLGQVVTGWRSGEKWTVAELAHRLGVDCSEMDLQVRPLVSQQEYNELKAVKEVVCEKRPTKKKRGGYRSSWKSALEGKEGFYRSCLKRCYEETREGTRYRSMCALVVVARKVVTISKEQVEQDLFELLRHYNSIGKYMKPSEVKKALKMYNSNALVTPSTTLEAWFGWEFRRDAQKRREKLKDKGKYVKRSRTEILARARKIQEIDYPDGEWRNIQGAPTAQSKVLQYRAEHPEAKPKDCIQATGLSKNTVYKWWNSGD